MILAKLLLILASIPTGAKTIYYDSGVMERVFANHQNPMFRRTGDYVPGLHRRPGIDCLTAVNWDDRWMVFSNRILTLDIWDPVDRRWERHECQASDWQQRKDRTSYKRYEVDGHTAITTHLYGRGRTVSQLIRIH